MTSVHDVAAAIIERHSPIDPLKLQKIVYFAAGEYMALTGRPMFTEDVEAWDYGPVVYPLYDTYRGFDQHHPIDSPIKGIPKDLDSMQVGCIESALAKYGELTGAKLIDLGHEEPAWTATYEAGVPRKVISPELIVRTFREKKGQALPADLLDAIFAS